MSVPINAREWLDVALRATTEVATDALACGSLTVGDAASLSPEREGAYIPLIAGREHLQVGILSDADGCRSLTRRLLMMDPSEDEPTSDMVVDAVGEIVNIVAGVIKRHVDSSAGSVELGLPIFVSGHVLTSEKLEAAACDLVLDDVKANLVVLRGAGGGHT